MGITASINYALETLKADTQDPDSLRQYIGPPLDEIFSTLLKTENTAVIEQAIAFYRERYSSIGYKENAVYTGIRDVLSELAQGGHKLYVATSKRPDIAMSVIQYFELQPYFVQILGCGLKRKKHELLTEIMKKENVTRLVMIGDRSHDMNAGRLVTATCMGVLWGYGSATELKAAGAEVLLQHPHEILGYLT